MEAVARRKAKGGPDWKVCKADTVGDAVVIEGGVPRQLKSGKHKGLPTWRDCKAFDKVIVTHDEIDREEDAYRDRTGNCDRCEGSGETLFRASADGTREYKPCRACVGTGKAKREAS